MPVSQLTHTLLLILLLKLLSPVISLPSYALYSPLAQNHWMRRIQAPPTHLRGWRFSQLSNPNTFITSSLFNVLASVITLAWPPTSSYLEKTIVPFVMLYLVAGINSLYLLVNLILVPVSVFLTHLFLHPLLLSLLIHHYSSITPSSFHYWLKTSGFVKRVGFKPGVKERGSYGMDVQSGESKEKEVTGEGIGESKLEKLVPEWCWRRDKGSWMPHAKFCADLLKTGRAEGTKKQIWFYIYKIEYLWTSPVYPSRKCFYKICRSVIHMLSSSALSVDRGAVCIT